MTMCRKTAGLQYISDEERKMKRNNVIKMAAAMTLAAALMFTMTGCAKSVSA